MILLLLSTLFLSSSSFTRVTNNVNSIQRRMEPFGATLHRHFMLPLENTDILSSSSEEHVQNAIMGMNLLLSSDDVAAATGGGMDFMDKLGGTAKGIVIFLFFGGGLIPAAIEANKALLNTLTGQALKQDKSASIPADKISLDPTRGAASYIESSGASGPDLPGSALLFANERIPLADVVAVVGRMGSDVNDLVDWRALPSANLEGLSDPENPPMWLPRATFKANIRKAKFLGWPTDTQTNQPIGGLSLSQTEEPRISKPNAIIGDAALDAVFDSMAWGAGVVTPDKVQRELVSWRPSKDEFDLKSFSGAAIRGRSVTAFAAISFIAIQVIAYGTLFVSPLLRVWFDLDIGFGQMGQCSGTCQTLF